MAKGKSINELLTGTPVTPAPAPTKTTKAAKIAKTIPLAKPGRPATGDPSVSISIGIRTGLLNQLNAASDDNNVARNALINFFIRYGLSELEKGNIKLPIKSRFRLDI